MSEPQSPKAGVTAVVLTRNEETRLGRCLDALTWVNEIIVVDDGSTDNTMPLARTYTQKVFQRRMDIEGRHRNWAYSQASHPWVLSIDADEVVTPELREEILRTLSAAPKENGFTIPRKNFIGDHWVKHGGWYPSPQLKLFRKEKFRYEEVAVHPRAFMDDPCGHLKSDLLHYSYRDFADYLAKLNKQTTWEANKWLTQGKPMRLHVFLWRTLDRFFRAYVGRQGFRDGFIGFAVAYFGGLYQFMSYLKYRELILRKENKE